MPELPILYAAGGSWVVHMLFVMKAVRGLAVLACVGLQWVSAAPSASPTQPQTPAETAAPGEPSFGDIGPARGFHGEAQRPAERSVSPEMSTGHKNLDLLMELDGRAGKGNEPANGSAADKDSNEAARAARKRLLEAGAPIPERNVPAALSSANQALLADPIAGRESDRDPAIESQRWSAGGEASGAGQDSADADNATGHRDYDTGASITNTTTRRVLMLLQEYRSWVIAGTVAATLLALASGRASRTRRRR